MAAAQNIAGMVLNMGMVSGGYCRRGCARQGFKLSLRIIF
jgi:hypothetical protein